MKTLFHVLAFLVLLFTIWAGYTDREAVMGIGTVLVFGLLFFAYIDKIAKFKAGADGIEAETREVVKEARTVTKEIRELGKILVENQISHLIRHSRLGSFGEIEQENRKNDLLQTLRAIGVEDGEVDLILKDWHTFTIRDYAYAILGEGQIPIHLGDDALADHKEMRERDLNHPPTPDEVEAFLTKYDLLTELRKEQLEDYRYYLENKEHRRLEEWENHNEWNLKDT